VAGEEVDLPKMGAELRRISQKLQQMRREREDVLARLAMHRMIADDAAARRARVDEAEAAAQRPQLPA
jgi:hypothetical protein